MELIEVKKTNADSFLPYPLLRYNNNFKYNKALRTYVPPDVQIIEPENIYRPAIIIPCFDRSNNFNHPYTGVSNTLRTRTELNDRTEFIRLWAIPYKVVDRAGYDMTTPAVQENPLYMQDEQINAIYDEDVHNIAEEEDDYYDEG